MLRIGWSRVSLRFVSVILSIAAVQPALAQEPEAPEILIDAPAVPGQLGELSYWLGVDCEPVGEALRAQLKLEEGQGLLVRRVMPESPAANCGIQPHDVLLQFNESKLGETSDLAKAVGEAKGEESTIRLIRAGDENELKVSPQKRPDKALAAPPERPAVARLRQWLPFDPGQEPFRMLFVKPGVVGPFEFKTPALPANSSLTIAREGDGPAKITFKQGDKTWETTADQVDELPEEVRPFVRRALGEGSELEVELHGPNGALIHKAFPGLPLAPPDADVRVEKFRLFRDEKEKKEDVGAAQKAPAEAPQPESAESAVGELRRAVQELRQELQKLRQERAERNK